MASPVSGSILFPEQRSELVEVIRDFTNVELQSETWRIGVGPANAPGETLGEAINFLGDLGLFKDSARQIGATLRDAVEARALDNLTAELDRLLVECGRTAAADVLLASQRWPEVVAKAQIALRALERAQLRSQVSVRKDVGADGARRIADSLSRGRVLSKAALLMQRTHMGTVFVFVRDVDPALGIDDLTVEHRVDRDEARAELSRLLAEIVSDSGRSLLFVVEDDLAKDPDPFLLSRPNWIRDGEGGVFYSMALTRSTVDAAPGFIDENCSGVPTNAFVLRASLESLGVEGGELRVPQQLASTFEDSLVAVVTEVFDRESYLVWIP